MPNDYLQNLRIPIDKCKIALILRNDDNLITATNDFIDHFVTFYNIFGYAMNESLSEATGVISDIIVEIISFSDNLNLDNDYYRLFDNFESWLQLAMKLIDSFVFYDNLILLYNKVVDGSEFPIVEIVNIDSTLSTVYANENFKFISVNDFLNLTTELIIINSKSYNKVRSQLISCGITYDRILPIIDENPTDIRHAFNINNRLKLKNTNFSIISNDCWGGFMYKQLGLPYNTPFVWLFIDTEDYLKLLKNISYYLSCKLTFTTIPGINYPVGVLDDIKIHFNHNNNEAEAEEKWYRRLQRFNWDNIFVKSTVCYKSAAIEFDRLDIKHKIAFTDKNFNLNSCVYMNKWEENDTSRQFQGFWQYIQFYSLEYIDIIKWLNGEDKFINQSPMK